ncbi:MAG: site-specific DNA-methyltransferase [Planctomycetota bacterium]|nr:MAG: site-specific DNA-methyltransferase [Planctomycetota bacterium]
MAKRSAKKSTNPKQVTALTHEDASRKNIPTAEFQSVMAKDQQAPVPVTYSREGVAESLADEKAARNRDLDPQLVWRGKDEQDWSDLVVHAPPLFIQEKVHPKVLIDDLRRRTEADRDAADDQFDLFHDFNGVPEGDAKTDFYQHDANWTNRMILGDSLQVMASLAEREGLRGQVQCIYFDPPYGIKFNSNFQWSTTSRDVKDGNKDHITREPEQVKAFRDTWRDGIHTYLTYLRDRLTVSRDLLHETGSIFVQIGDENVHRVRTVMDEVFGDANYCALIPFVTTSSQTSELLPSTFDFLLWYAKDRRNVKFRSLLREKIAGEVGGTKYKSVQLSSGVRGPAKSLVGDDVPEDARLWRPSPMVSQSGGENSSFPVEFEGKTRHPRSGFWKTNVAGVERLHKADRLVVEGRSIAYVRFIDDYPVFPLNAFWDDTWGVQSRSDPKRYVVQTAAQVIQRCQLLVTDPGDLVLDPTCGSGTTAYVAEQWGRRWITIDTSRVSLALARTRIMGARYPFYLLADSKEGVEKEAAVTRSDLPDGYERRHYAENTRHGFVYERVPHITLKAIANNAEIDVIWERSEAKLASVRQKLTKSIPAKWLADFRKAQKYTAEVPPEIQEWEIPRDRPAAWPEACQSLLDEFWKLRIARQKEIDASIAAKAEFEYLYDKPYEDKKKVRVAGPFTVESLSPHRTLGVDENDDLIDPQRRKDTTGSGSSDEADFVRVILENLKAAGVQQAHKEDKIAFSSVAPWPGRFICAEGHYTDQDGASKRAGIFIGPEFGTVARQDLVAAAREAGDADFDVLIACAFNFEAIASEFNKLGRIPVLKARMNAELHMGDQLKSTGAGNLFVIFGEPDIDILPADGGQIQVKINGVDVFHPSSGEVRSDNADGIACWFIDTDYNEESFFVRHAYFLGQNDPYKALKTTLKAEINEEAWETLNSDTSRPFKKPKGGRIAVKVINHLGDEVMKVFRVE